MGPAILSETAGDSRGSTAPLMHGGEHISQQAGGEELDTHDDEKDTKHHQWMPILNRAGLPPKPADVGPDSATRHGAEQSESAKNVHGCRHEADDEGDRQQIEEAIEQTFGAKLRHTKLASMMRNRALAHTIPGPVGDGGQKPIELSIQIRKGVFGDFASIDLESTIEIVEADPRNDGGHQIEDLRRQRLR